MFFVWALALVGLFLIYLEFFLPSAIMAIGGGILLLASIFMFHMIKPSIPVLVAYLIALSGGVYVVVKFAQWKVGSVAKNRDVNLKEMIGKRATTATDLAPLGHIFIDDQVFEARCQNGSIEKGTNVVVVGGTAKHLIVQVDSLHS
ncbi:MAG: hypothetical protein KGJ02_03425 [Verrucomicrobiota bacterium]|nr:hypothetical protein [Verrucomicrobiota bacterium]